MRTARRALLAGLLLLAGCASLPTNVERQESRALTDTASTRLGRSAEALLLEHPGESAFLPLVEGVDALLARIAMADAAERSLDVQYYIWHDDLTGRHFGNALLRAADRGVRVRILLDDLGVGADDEKLLALEAHANVEIRLFNPVASRSFRGLGVAGDFSRLNRRMHNKSFIADNQAAILGGRNIGDEYFGAHGEVAFGDLDVLMAGPGVADVSRAFDLYWNAEVSFPVSALVARRAGDEAALARLRGELATFLEGERKSPYVTRAQERAAELFSGGRAGVFYGAAHLLHDDPTKVSRAPEETEGHLIGQFAGLGGEVRRELFLVSPYFVPGKAGVAWLAGLAKRGVQVTVLTNSLAATDVAAVHAGYRRYRDALLDAGIRIWELRPDAIGFARDEKKRPVSGSRASLHAKTFVFDRRAVFIGSLNLDPRSARLNTEIGVVCESAPLAESIESELEGNLDRIAWRVERIADPSGRAQTTWSETGPSGTRQYLEDPAASTWRRFSSWFLSLLPIESQL